MGILILIYRVGAGINRDSGHKMPRIEDIVGTVEHVRAFPQREREPCARRPRAELRRAAHARNARLYCRHAHYSLLSRSRGCD